VGDLFENLSKPVKQGSDKAHFKPAGKAPESLLGKLEYIGSPEIRIGRKNEKTESAKKAFLTNAGNADLFQPKIEYFSNLAKNVSLISDKSAVPFKPGGVFHPSPIVAQTETTHVFPSPQNMKVEEGRGSRAAFRPACGHVNEKFPEYIVGENESVPQRMREKKSEGMGAWKFGGPLTLSANPQPSIVLNLFNLKRCFFDLFSKIYFSRK
jgi:hypothetical protein